MSTNPPPPPFRPLPPTPPTDPIQPNALEQVNRVAETIAGPNLRVKDNLMQLIACVGGAVLGGATGAVGALVTDGELVRFALVGTIIGLVAGLFASGIALMVLGFVRASKRKS